MNYTYLLINFFVILIPLIYTFHPRLKFFKQYPSFFFSTFLVGIIFVVWDIYFTHNGYWGFNPNYITGIHIFSLPIEEILFFFCIPYACIFTYHVLECVFPVNEHRYAKRYSILFSITLFALGTFFLGKWYTSITFISLSVVVLIGVYLVNVTKFYRAYLILMIPFIITNGILTGSCIEDQVVWYNDNYNLGLRIFTIPVEDVFYGMLLLFSNVIIYELLRKSIFKRV